MLLKNIFETSFRRRSLICYISEPFQRQLSFPVHSNERQVKSIAMAIRDLQFNVDVCSFSDTVERVDHDFIFGQGPSFVDIVGRKTSAVAVFYATGAHSFHNNRAELDRLLALAGRRGTRLLPKRLNHTEVLAYASDAVICTGNQWTIGTYAGLTTGPVFRAPVSVYQYPEALLQKRDIEAARTSFMWIGGSGNILKGLDLVIEAFAKLPYLSLHICGHVEDEILALYADELENCRNIVCHGFLNVASADFEKLLRKCAFAVFPSASEAGAGSLLTAMGAGAIPVATIEASVDLGDYGFPIESPTVEGVRRAVEFAASTSPSSLAEMSRKSRTFVQKNHTFWHYDAQMRSALREIVGSRFAISSDSQMSKRPSAWREIIIDCRIPRLTSSCLGYGWSEFLPDGIWSIGREASLQFHVPRLPDNLVRLTFHVLPLALSTSPARTVKVIVNGREIAIWSFDKMEWRDVRCDVPQSLMGDCGFVDIRFLFEKSHGSAEGESAKDAGRLGFMLQTITASDDPTMPLSTGAPT